ncbi:hypothetical protein NRIC_10300 [Enterococcus florum]|uniref:Addiction module toxin RelE n=2 Tax=Enterococcus florum TaxID=2480627 RepID=A0A4V0WPA1_9ENTE|nr:hypothetical protein NRIC_10300 [Enterococcus florum]
MAEFEGKSLSELLKSKTLESLEDAYDAQVSNLGDLADKEYLEAPVSRPLEITKKFHKQIKKMDRFAAKIILMWLSKYLEGCEDAKVFGKELVGNYAGKLRYKVGDYRVICTLDNQKLIVLALELGHRREVHKKQRITLAKHSYFALN